MGDGTGRVGGGGSGVWAVAPVESGAEAVACGRWHRSLGAVLDEVVGVDERREQRGARRLRLRGAAAEEVPRVGHQHEAPGVGESRPPYSRLVATDPRPRGMAVHPHTFLCSPPHIFVFTHTHIKISPNVRFAAARAGWRASWAQSTECAYAKARRTAKML